MLRKGFLFAPEEVSSKKPVGILPQCGQCGLYKKCLSPKMPLSGNGKKGILIVGEAPGKTEDEQNRPFVGDAGQYLRDTLSRLDVDLRGDCWILNSLACRPPKNATPTDKQIVYCQPNVVNHIKELKPELILLLGGSAVRSVMGWLWGNSPGGITRWTGWQIPHQNLNAWICPTYHPSRINRSKDDHGKPDPVLEMQFEKHLRLALETHTRRKRPWREPPDYKNRVSVVVSPTQAVQYLQAIQKKGRPVAFDFETEGLKPDGNKLQIYSCAVSDGEITASYPWHGRAIEETTKLIHGPQPKIAANLKFEERFCIQYLFSGATNWVLDTVVAAHTLDNRPSVAGLKFQAFVLLGQEPYNDTIKPYLESREPGGYAKNRIRDANLDKLLMYGGLDALLEWKVAEIQAKKLGIDLFAGCKKEIDDAGSDI